MFNTDFPIYGFLIIISLIANIIIVAILGKKYHFSLFEIIGAIVYENIGIIVGAKLLSYIQNYSNYATFDFIKLGLSSYGGLIGAIICIIIFSFQFKKNLKEMVFIFLPPVPLVYSIGKIGCFLVGCCYGVKYSGLGSISYRYSLIAPNNVELFPIQLIESIVFFLIFLYMIIKVFKNKFNWNIVGLCFVFCGLSKFFLDYLRASHTIFLSLNQKISLIFVLIGLFIVFINKNFKEKKHEM